MQTQNPFIDAYRNGMRSAAEAAWASAENAVRLQKRQLELWSSLWQAAAESQKALLDQVSSQMGQAKDRAWRTYEQAERAQDDAVGAAVQQVERAAESAREMTPPPQVGQRKGNESRRHN